MKKITLQLVVVLMFLHATTFSQTKINFRNFDSYEQMLAVSKQENKPIFIDCCTTWCAPCKKMDAEVFGIDSVIAYYNRNFICVKANIETKDTTSLEYLIYRKYKTHAIPTLLFINGKNELMHKITGYSFSIKQLLVESKAVCDGKKKYFETSKLFESGDRSLKTLTDYFNCNDKSGNWIFGIINQFIATAPEYVLFSDSCWNFLTYKSLVNYKHFDFILENESKYRKVVGDKKVDAHIMDIWSNPIPRYVDRIALNKYCKELLATNNPLAERSITLGYLLKEMKELKPKPNKKSIESIFLLTEQYLKNDIFNQVILDKALYVLFTNRQLIPEKNMPELLEKWNEQSISAGKNYRNIYLSSLLYENKNNKELAKQAAQESLQLAIAEFELTIEIEKLLDKLSASNL